MGALAAFLLPAEAVWQRQPRAFHHIAHKCGAAPVKEKNYFLSLWLTVFQSQLPAITGSVTAILVVTPQSKWVSVGMNSYSHLSSPHSPLFCDSNEQKLDKWGRTLQKRERWRSTQKVLAPSSFVWVTLPNRRHCTEVHRDMRRRGYPSLYISTKEQVHYFLKCLS